MDEMLFYDKLPVELRRYWFDPDRHGVRAVSDYLVNVPEEERYKLKTILWDYLSQSNSSKTSIKSWESTDTAV